MNLLGFGHHGLNNLQSSIMNQQQQQNSPAQVNVEVQEMLQYLKTRYF